MNNTVTYSSILILIFNNTEYKKAPLVICTPKVRHFWRCIFFMAKKGSKKKMYSTEFTIGVIMDMREHRLRYSEAVRKYSLGAVETGGARER